MPFSYKNMGIFSRKQKTPVQPEERSINLGGLMFNSSSSYSESRAMKLSAFYCGVNQISNAVAMLPINIVKYDYDEKQPIQHSLWRILNLAPDQKFNHFGAFKAAVESVIITGNAYFLIERDERLNVKALHYINSDYVQPMPQTDGTIKYLVVGMKEAVPAENMIHLWMHVDEMFNGISLLRYAYNTLKGSTNAEETANSFYAGGAGLNGILKASSVLTNDQKKQIRESWQQAFQSGGNGIAVLPQGLDYQPVSVSPEDAQLLESREFNVVEIARFLNISPIKLFQLDEVSYSSMESTQLYFLQDTITPYVQIFVEEFNRKLFKPSEVGKIGVMFDYTNAMQTNRKELAEYYRILLTNGIMSIDEIRGQMGLPKLGTKAGESHFIQLSYASAEDIAEGKYIKNKGNEGTQDPNQTKVAGEE